MSEHAKDLINKLLQPLPIKRIKLGEIKEHPWFVQDLPLYLVNLMEKKPHLHE
jgi:serine/threonine protein kinase